MIRVFIGYDPREEVSFHVLARSIEARASEPVMVVPISLRQLAWFDRRRDEKQSTDFSFSRFLVPYLSGFDGWSVFMDCDMLCRGDIAELWALQDDRYAVQCVKREHVPREGTKFLGAVQTAYAKKNWSSVMLMNNARCRALVPGYVNTASGLQLHQFQWLGSDALIGGLPRQWNHLVGYDEPDEDAKLVHYTLGGPWFEDTKDCEYAAEWRKERDLMLGAG